MLMYRPKSFLTLVLIGFSLVALPLIVAIVNATIHVDRLAEQSQQAVSHAVQVTQGSRMLVEQLIAMERNARQFQILGDDSLFQVYATTHQKFQHAIEGLAKIPLDTYQKRQLGILADKEQDVFNSLQSAPRDSVESKRAAHEFPSLAALAQSLLTTSTKFIDRETARMQTAAVKARKVLIWQLFALIPGSFLFSIIFVLLISRPIKQIDQAIRRLGDGDFSQPATVTGPRDLEYLGGRLNWLRLRLVELEEEKRKFLQHVSHELKTPLTAVREGADLLAEEVVGPLDEKQLEIVYILQHQSENLQKLIEDLLNFSMAQARNASFDLKLVPLHRLLEDAAHDHKPAIMSKKIDLEIISAEVVVHADAEKLRTVIDNLFSNAVKYSPEGGKISVSLHKTTDHAVLDIIDSGPGIAPEDGTKIFEAFYQGKMVHDGPVQGSGIGLSIAREYLFALNGSIDIVDNDDEGGHFRVMLPLHARI